MPFKENDSRINRDGRPKGAKNKVPYNLREKINEFLSDNFETIKKDFEKLEPKDKIKFYLDFLNYTLPKFQGVKVESQKTESYLLEDIVPLKFVKTEKAN